MSSSAQYTSRIPHRCDHDTSVRAGTCRRIGGRAVGRWVVSALAVGGVILAGAQVSYADGPGRKEAGSAVPAGDGLYGYTAALYGSLAVVGDPTARNQAGQAFFFVRSGTKWHKQAVLSGPPNENLGESVAVTSSKSSATAVVGATDVNNSNAGATYIYGRSRSGSRWRLQVRLPDPGHHSDDNFGSSAAISGGTVVLGAETAKSFAGLAYVYVRSGTHWRLRATLSARGSMDFGVAVAISSSTIVIGADMSDSAYIYARSATGGWHLQARLTDPAGGSFGSSVSIVGATVAIGAPGAPGGGRVFIYGRSGRRWSRTATLTEPHANSNDSFGTAVGISGRRMVIGDRTARGYCGLAFEYVRARRHWREREEAVNPNCSAVGWFGSVVAVSGRTALVAGQGQVFVVSLR